MLIFGSRMYGRRNVVKGWGHCDNCGKYGKNTSYSGRKWGHLYFIPLIPMGSRVRVVKECKKCSHGMHLEEKEIPAVLDGMRQTSDSALVALVAGQKEFDDDGTTTPCAACLASSVELLYCLCERDYVRLVLASLQEKSLTYAYHLVNGESLEFHGKLDEAAESYRQAVQCEPNDALPLVSLGIIHLKNNDYEGARPLYEKALELSQDRFSVLRALLVVYEGLKDNDRLSDVYEECFQFMPELTKDKQVFKAYKKACKKAGRQPIAP